MEEYGEKIDAIREHITKTMLYFLAVKGFQFPKEVWGPVISGEQYPKEIQPDWSCKNSDECITLYDITHFRDLATALYLEKWLQNDKQALRNISSFTYYGFAPIKRDKEGSMRFGSNEDNYDNWPSYEQLLYAEKKYNRFLKIRHAQAQKDGYEIGPDIAAVKRRKSELVEDISPSLSRSGGKWYSFRELSFMLLLAKNEFHFFDLLVTRRVMLEKINGKNRQETMTESNNLLHNAYISYYSTLENMKDEEDALVYTVNAMTIRNLEAHFSPSLALRLAIHLNRNDMIDMETALNNVKQWLYYDVRETPFFPGTRTLDAFDDVLGSLYITEMSTYADESIRNACGRKNIVMRNIMHNVLAFTDKTEYRASKMPSWQEADYKFASKFYKTAYPVIENHYIFSAPKEVPPSKWDDKFYDLIRRYYHFWENNGEMGFIRDSYRRNR